MRYIINLLIVTFLFSCNSEKEKTGTSLPCIQSFVQTFPQINGNRYIESIGLLNSESLQISLGGKPLWIAGLTVNNQQYWAVTLDDGTIELVVTQDRKIVSHDKNWKKIPSGAPPVFGFSCDGDPIIINEFIKEAAPFAAPIPLADNKFAYISDAGDLVISSENDTVSLSINAMHDSRIIKDKNNRLLVLTNPAQYHHGVLGDHTEARGIAIIETSPEIKVQKQFVAPDSSVIEGVGAIWEDLNGDGKLEIAVTLSNNAEGTGGKHVVFNEDGKVIASGKDIKPDGWRHLLLAFKPKGSRDALLAAIQKPHVDRLLKLYKWEGDSLITIAQLHGFSTHIGGSRNLDGVLGTDMGNDGNVEIFLPNIMHDTLYAVSYKDAKFNRIWSSPIQGSSNTNIAHVGNGSHAAIALGTDQNVMEIWFTIP